MKTALCVMVLLAAGCAPRANRVVTYEDAEIAWRDGKCVQASVFVDGTIVVQRVKRSVCRDAFRDEDKSLATPSRNNP